MESSEVESDEGSSDVEPSAAMKEKMSAAALAVSCGSFQVSSVVDLDPLVIGHRELQPNWIMNPLPSSGSSTSAGSGALPGTYALHGFGEIPEGKRILKFFGEARRTGQCVH